jgi:hypothetical protein
MRVRRGVEMQLHSFLTSGLDGGKWLAVYSGRPHYPRGNIFLYSVNRRLGRLHRRSINFGEEEILLLLSESTQISRSSSSKLVTKLTEISPFRYDVKIYMKIVSFLYL